jgi:2,3-dihydroxyphenylpropionate 1,2-dioxygenase
MPLALATTSHSPLMGVNQPVPEVVVAVDAALDQVRATIRDFDPELVVIFAPDHYNGVFYDLLPPFCIGAAATACGDYGTRGGPLDVDRDAAHLLTESVLASGVDVAMSERMTVDHGFAQPLELLLGSTTAKPVVPIFINCVAEPLCPVSRIRLLGEAVGRAALALDRRVLLVGSGGLSHDPPVPRLAEAPPEVVERLVAGRDPSREQRAEREQRVIAAGRGFALGTTTLQPLNPGWDRQVMQLLAEGRLQEIDGWSNAGFVEQGGHSAHEVRNWIAAYAALSAAGDYEVTTSFYRAIPEWIAGFGITAARTRT